MTKSESLSENLLKFYFVDNANGTGKYQWGTDSEYVLDLSSNPLQGAVRVITGNQWITRYGYVGILRYSATEYPYVALENFQFEGQTDFGGVHFEFGRQQLTDEHGTVNRDNRLATVYSEDSKAIAVDLQERYNLDILLNYTTSGNRLWNVLLTKFSSSELNDVNLVEWGNSDFTDARWLLFVAEPVPSTASGSEVTFLDTLRVYPDISYSAPNGRAENSEWDLIGDVATDGDLSTYVTQLEYPVVAVDMTEVFNVTTFQIVDHKDLEYLGRVGYMGWGSTADYVYSKSLTNSPGKVQWNSWTEYSDENKVATNMKWLAFKEETFDVDAGYSGPKRLAALRATTRGVEQTTMSEYQDLVDFTEFAGWFETPYRDEKDITLLTPLEADAGLGLLFGSSTVKSYVGLEDGTVSQVFNEDENVGISLYESPYYIWRTFGEVVADEPDEVIEDPNFGTFRPDASQIGDPYLVLSGVEADGFSVKIADNSPGKPDTVKFQVLSGVDPTEDTNWITYIQEDGLAEEEFVNDQARIIFNGDQDLKVYFGETLTLSGFRVVFENIEYSEADGYIDENLTIHDVSLYTNLSGTEAATVVISNDLAVRESGRRSLKLTYRSGNVGSTTVTAGGALQIRRDPLWSVQDFLGLYMMIDKPELLDLENCFIRIGQDADYYYEWPFSYLQNEINSVQLEEHRLRFLEAPKQGIPGLNANSEGLTDAESKVDFQNGPIGFLEFEIKPSGLTTEDINIWMDNFNVRRENFTLPGRYNPTLYLNNSEHLYFPTAGFDMKRGFFEAIITPDWNFRGSTTVTAAQAFTIFTVVSELDDTFSCTYTEHTGLLFTISTKEDLISLTLGRLLTLEPYVPFKLAVAWDAEGKDLDRAGTTLKVWMDDIVLGEFKVTWTVQEAENSQFYVGGKAPATDIAIDSTVEFGSSVPNKLVPDIYSVTGGVENFILSRSPKKYVYSEIVTLKDKIEISMDGVNYYSGDDYRLPFVLSSVAPGQSFDVWIKTNFPKDTRNMARTAYLRTRWRRL
jgi:hypothetical protein